MRLWIDINQLTFVFPFAETRSVDQENAALNCVADSDSSNSWCVDIVLLFVLNIPVYDLMFVVIRPSWLPNLVIQ